MVAQALRLDNPAGLDAVGTYSDSSGLTVLDSPDLLKVGVPAFFVLVVGMTDIEAHHGFFTTDFTYL